MNSLTSVRMSSFAVFLEVRYLRISRGKVLLVSLVSPKHSKNVSALKVADDSSAIAI